MNILSQAISRKLSIFCIPAICLLFSTAFVQAQTGLPYHELDLSTLNDFQSPSENWKIAGDVYMDLYDRLHIQPENGNGILVNTNEGDNPLDIFTTWEHGDLDLEFEFMMARASNSGIYLQGRYEIQMLDSWGVEHPRFGDMGGVYQWWEDGVGKGGIPPRVNASRAPGLWQHIQIKFRAPQFDENGEKIAHARLEEVILNGVMIHVNVDLIHPTGGAISNDEAEFGPLRFQGDHGPVAFRNIKYKTYHNQPLKLNNFTYRYYSGVFESASDVVSGDFISEGTGDRISLGMLRESAEIGVVFTGQLSIDEAGDYYFDLRSDGGHHFKLNGESISETDDSNRRQNSNSVTILLEEGSHPFEITYFRGARGGQPALGLFAEGPGINMHRLHESASLPMGTQNIPLLVEPVKEPVLMHGFMDSGDRVHPHTAAVGFPGGINFALDQNSGALMKIWKGDFINAATMWVGRGGRNLSLNEDTAINISPSPSLYYLHTGNERWPETMPDEMDYRFSSYRIHDNSIAFNYRLGNVTIQEVMKPGEEARQLMRTMRFQPDSANSLNNLYVRAARGENISRLANNLYQVNDKTYFIKVNEDTGNSARIRTYGSVQELMIPVSGSSEVTIEFSYIW